MKIITLNCCLSPWSPRRNDRLPYIVKALVKEKPDIIFLQEVFFKRHADYFVKGLLKNGFVDFFYSKSLLIISKYSLISRTYYDFKPHHDYGLLGYIYELGNLIYGSGYQFVELEIDKKKILFTHTHLLSAFGKDYGVYQKVRLRELKEVCEHLKKKNSKYIIFAGDFNFDFNSPSYKTITERYKFNDPFRKIEGNTISSDNLNRKSRFLVKMDQRLDYIFTKGFEKNRKHGEIVFQQPVSTSKGKTHVSDHYGLSLDIV